MFDILVFWDARESPTSLRHFIDTLKLELSSYSKIGFVELSDKHDPSSGQLKASMRGLLDYISDVQPNRLVCFGSHPCVLGRLIQPALRCPLYTNQLPFNMDKSSKKRVRLEPVTRFLLGGDIWSSDDLSSNYIYCDDHELDQEELLSVGIISEDSKARLYERQLEKVGLTASNISKRNVFNDYRALFKNVGLLMLSSEIDPDGKLVDIANALGKPVLLVSELGTSLGVEEGVNGWIVYSAIEQRLLQCLVNWREMSPDARRVLSQYAKRHQSKRSGISRYFSQFELKKHKELNSFQKNLLTS